MKCLTAVLFAILLILPACSADKLGQQPGGTDPLSSPTIPEQAAKVTPVPSSTSPAQTPPIVQTQSSGADSEWIAVIKLDGNIWLENAATGAGKQITEDGNGSPQAGTSPADKAIYHCCSTWSSDGKLLAFRKVIAGTQWQASIWVYDVARGQAKQVLNDVDAGSLAFRPGTHLVAYDEALDPGYFVNGKPDASRARGILALDADTGQTSELVKPERGLWLSEPRWSPDGNLLGFVEQTVYEDPVPFAFYDFKYKAYHSWNQVIGDYAFAPDGQHIAYDRRINGTVSGNERVWVNDLSGKGERLISPADGSMAYGAAWSPRGDLLANKLGEQNVAQPAYGRNVIVVQPAAGGAARKLGTFAGARQLEWSPDGNRIAFASGPDNEPHVKLVMIADGSARDLGPGYEPVWQP